MTAFYGDAGGEYASQSPLQDPNASRCATVESRSSDCTSIKLGILSYCGRQLDGVCHGQYEGLDGPVDQGRSMETIHEEWVHKWSDELQPLFDSFGSWMGA
jgi:hypothetical protein